MAVRLPGALGAVRDVLLQLGTDQVQESVVLKDRVTALALPGYTNVFTVPAGAAARQRPIGVEFVDRAGAVLATFGGGHAFDASAAPESAEPATAPVATRLVGQAGRSVTVSVSVEAGWLADPARVLPVTIDPEFNGTAAPVEDAYVDAANPTTDLDTLATALYARTDDLLKSHPGRADLLHADPTLAGSRPGQVLIGDKNYYGRDFEADLAHQGIELLRRARKGEPERPGGRFFKPLRQTVESIYDTLKGQLDLEQHGGRTTAGVFVRVVQRLLALTAAIRHNDNTGQPLKRSLLAYDH